ncbi:MAG: rRNA maturation RNase YbeY [Clostridia bacterium]|nr:rRNA maturation RNase YbeY [Clostridia bacterium]
MPVKVLITNRQRKIKLPPGTRKLVEKTCTTTLNYENFKDNAEVEVTFVTDEQIRELNRNFRNIDSATDVLSFPLGENGVYDKNPLNDNLMLGDVIISIEHALAQSELYGHSIEREIAFLTVHSMLHLLGYDHIDEGIEKKIMREKEEKILLSMGLAVYND